MSERLTIVCFSSQPWDDGMWTNKQHVMSRVAKQHRVVFVNFGGQSPFKFAKKHGVPLTSLRRPAVRRISDSLEVLDVWAPTWLNFLGRGHAARQCNDFERRVDAVGDWLREQGLTDVVVWVYHPGYGAAVRNQGLGSTGLPALRISKYNAGLWRPPDSPTVAMVSPAVTFSPTSLYSRSLWP